MHNEHRATEDIVQQLQRGQQIALITDAGTPGISDPGFLLAKACVEHKISMECLPGATAFVPALVVSGLPNNEFTFVGFLPVKKGRKAKLELLANEKNTLVFYESPHKIGKTLHDLANYFGKERNASLSREISKKFEETLRGTLAELILITEQRSLKGEMVLIVEGKK